MTVTVLWNLLLWLVGIVLMMQIILVAYFSFLDSRQICRSDTYPTSDLPVLNVDGSKVNIYMEGRTLFADMLAAIDQAQERIFFETFIWQDDEIGQLFRDAFVRKAEQGVEVYLIFDRLGNQLFAHSRLSFPELPHLHVLPFLSFTRLRHLFWRSRWNVTHRKMLVIDESVGFVGGYNIGKEYIHEWRDTHVRFEEAGGIDGLAYAFVDFWNTYRHKQHPILAYPSQDWLAHIQVYRNDPLRRNFPIRSLYLEAVERATERIVITNAYFVPDPSLRQALLTAVKRGVQVDVMLPWRSNHTVVDWIARFRFSRYLDAGVNLYGYEMMNHAKTIVVDGKWSMIGTANLDRLSLASNHEINVEIFDRQVAKQMEAIFDADKSNARRIDPGRWKKRRLVWKLGESLLSPLWPFI